MSLGLASWAKRRASAEVLQLAVKIRLCATIVT